MSTAPRPIIIDTDPGQDDAVAILLALASPELDLKGITCVAGNVPLDYTTANARKICEVAGRPEVKIFAGCDRPLVGDLVTAEHVHGLTGLDGANLPDPTMALQDEHAVDWMIETLVAAGEAGTPITLCTLGPLTNVATAFAREPGIAAGIERIVAMAGSIFEGGNVAPAAEFNVYVDPEAAEAVFTAGVPVTLIPLDVTHHAIATKARSARIAAKGGPVADAVAGMLNFYNRFDEGRFGLDGGALHDPCVIAWLLRPGLFGGREVNLRVECASPLVRGMTVVDWWGVTGRPKSALVLTEIDDDGFFALLEERLARLPAG